MLCQEINDLLSIVDNPVENPFSNTESLIEVFTPAYDKIYSHIQVDSDILIIDDKDADGVLSAYIIKQYIDALKLQYRKETKKRNKGKLNIHQNDIHGITTRKMLLECDHPYDLIIIVDSSTNLVDDLSKLNTDIVILDHHEYSGNEYQPITRRVTSLGANEIINISSTKLDFFSDFPVSAGVLCFYFITLDNKLNFMDIDKFRWYKLMYYSIITMFSDMVADSEKSVNLLKYFNNNIEEINNEISEYNRDPDNAYSKIPIINKWNKNNIQFNISPKLNHNKRLHDTSIFDLFYMDYIDLSSEEFDIGYSKSKQYVNIIYDMADIVELSKVYTAKFDHIKEYLNVNLTNYKGLVCNRILYASNKTTLGIVRSLEDENVFEISVRSKKNVLDFFLANTDLYISGGGHKSACGFKATEKNIFKIVSGLEEYLIEHETDMRFSNIIEVNCLSEISEEDFQRIANYNEHFSNSQNCIIVSVNNSDKIIHNVTSASSLGITGVYKDSIIGETLELQPFVNITTKSNEKTYKLLAVGLNM